MSVNSKNRHTSVLYIGMDISSGCGYFIVHERNMFLLKALFDEVSFMGLRSNTRGSLLTKLLNGWKGNYFRLSKDKINKILDCIREDNVQMIFIGNTLSAYIAKIIKKTYPQLIIVSFFHNCECVYFKEELKQDVFNLIHLAHVLFSFRSERLAIKYSDYLWGLTQRDSDLVKKIYGKGFDLLLPTSFIDKSDRTNAYNISLHQKLRLLFAGSDHFANIHGLNWFVKNVLPFIDVELTIIGSGMDKRFSQSIHSNIKVRGFVDDLSEYYYNSDIVISPIFLGSGMKTKTAEAMMYARPVIATKEAFVGYDIDPNRIGAQCNSASEFISWINYYDMHREELVYCSKYSRFQFEENYIIQKSIDKTTSFFMNVIHKHPTRLL
jgi:hypothetical protein